MLGITSTYVSARTRTYGVLGPSVLPLECCGSTDYRPLRSHPSRSTRVLSSAAKVKTMLYGKQHMKSATRVRPSRFALAAAMVGLLACDSSGSGSLPDSGTDGGMDSGIDSGMDSGTDSGTDSGVSGWRIFVTDTVQNANFGGLAGADELCANQAAAADLGGDFKAWLSTLSSPVSDRVTHASSPYVLVDGTMVANDWDDLVDSSILAAINLDANGEPRTGDVWTGTLATGASFPDDDCAGFTSGSAGSIGLCGESHSLTATWTQNITPPCSTPLRLYCIEATR